MRSLARTLASLVRPSRLPAPLHARLAAWQRLRPADLAIAHRRARSVVVDVEPTGLDLRRDTPIAIGAIGVRDGTIALDDAFHVVLRQDEPSADANILIHGIGGEVQRGGRDPRLALLDFVEYAGNAVLVAFRAEFDRPMLARAMRDHLGADLALPMVDLAFLLPALFRGAECGTLDEWLARCGGTNVARHDALADAYATAQLLLVALGAADALGMDNARRLLAMQKAQRWLGTR